MSVHLVTGGAGYVGSNIARMLKERGEEVIVFDILPVAADQDPDIKYIQGDVTDRSVLREAFKSADFVHHNAALVPLSKAGKKFRAVNLDGTRNVLELADEQNIEFVSSMSSSAIYGINCAMPINDQTVPVPADEYGHSKLEADKLVIEALTRGQAMATIRPRTVIGGKRLGIFGILFEWIQDNANIYVIGDGNNLFQFVHVDDLSTVSIEACLQRKPGIYNVGAEEFSTLRADLEYLIGAAGSRSKVKSLPSSLSRLALQTLDLMRLSPLAPYHYLMYGKSFYFDLTTTRETLNWEPKHTNREMLVEAYNQFVKSRAMGLRQEGSTHSKPVKQGILKLLKAIS